MGVGLLLLGAAIVYLLSVASVKTGFAFTPKEGVTAFAVLYLQAQFIERILEPFSEGKVTSKNLFGDTVSIKRDRETITKNERRIAALAGLASSAQTLDVMDKLSQAESEMQGAKESEATQSDKRVYGIWGMASLLGMILAYFTVGLFTTVGGVFPDWEISGHAWDAILSGVIVGAGTKPIHDLVEVLEKQEKKE